MTIIHSLLLTIFNDSIQGNKTDDPDISPKEWSDLIHLAKQQDILPLILQNVYSCSSFKRIDKSSRDAYRDQALSVACRQIIQTNEFLTIILHAQGLDPVVLKGIICRNLYPQPCLRPSVDEDILVSQNEVVAVHEFLLNEGLFADEPSVDPQKASKISYHKEKSPTYIEIQKTLFDPDSDVFGEFNKLFEGAMERTVRIQIEDVSVRTLAPTDHLLYLILHAFKHFVHSGIGIRAVCDIGMFAEHYDEEIDWSHIRKCLEEVHAFDFSRSLFHIVQQYLLLDAKFYGHISDWQIDSIDVEPLLDDILAGGVHGNSSLERLHSSNITLDAVSKDKRKGTSETKGRSNSSEHASGSAFLQSAFHSIFLPLEKMSGRYPYLKKAPFLLPIAWCQRIGGYLNERKTENKGGAAESIRLGNSRVELLRKYGIIK